MRRSFGHLRAVFHGICCRRYKHLAKTIFWSYAYADCDNERQMAPDAAQERILANVHNGAVLLLHPTSATNAAILGEVIHRLKADGYRFGTLDELCGVR